MTPRAGAPSEAARFAPFALVVLAQFPNAECKTSNGRATNGRAFCSE